MSVQDARDNARHIILVDVYESAEHGVPQTARHIAQAFVSAGFSCIRVQSSPEPPVYASARTEPGNYVLDLTHDGDLGKTVDVLREYRPIAVVPGGEYGVAFADVLAEALGVATSNGTALSLARRDKAVMAEAVAAAGIPTAAQLRVTDPDELRAWHARVGGRVVVKPLSSAGGDGVTFCDTPGESVAAFRRLVDTPDVFSRTNTAVLAQEYLVGTEYIVNTVSRDGEHHAAEIWRSQRLDVNGIRDLSGGCYIVPRQGAVQDSLVDYAFRVLDAVGVAHGPAHVELKLTPGGPRLVEVGARLSGGDLPHYARLATGESQIDWTVDAYVRPRRFHARRGTPYEIDRHFAWAALVSPVEGTLRAYPRMAEVRAMESYLTSWELVRPGDRIVPTVDDTTYPVIVNLMHEVEEVVMRDLSTIRYLDGVGFYDC